jgi:hypothetical protein
VVLWDQHTQVIFNESIILESGFTESVHFSADSELVIIETGNKHPINILNLTSLSVQHSIVNSYAIRNAFFLDNGNRFLMIQSNISIYLYYDLHAASILPVTFVGLLTTTNILEDPDKGYLHCLGTTGVTTFGVRIVEGNETLAAPGGLPVTNSTSNNYNNSTSNVTNQTNITSNSTTNGTNSSVNGSTEALQYPAES